MGVRPFGSGYDPNSGYPPDDSTNIPWDSDVDLSGYGSFGPGGFAPNPKLTGPATGAPPGLSLSGPGGNAGGGTFDPRTPPGFRGPRWGGNPPPGFNMDDQVIPPENSTIPNMKSLTRFTGGNATDAVIRAGMKYLPKILSRRIPLADLVTPTDELASAEAPTNLPSMRPSGVPNSGPSGGPGTPPWGGPWGVGPKVSPTPAVAGPGITRGPVPVNAPVPTPFTQPQHPSTMRYPMWPTPPAPTAAPSAGGGIGSDANFPVGPPITAPAVPPPRPRAGPAVVAQKPNLGLYDGTITRPNMDVTQGGRNNPGQQTQMGVLDWSKLFQRPQQ